MSTFSTQWLQGSAGAPATANGNGSAADSAGSGTQVIEIVESNGGTATVTVEGSFDGTNWYAAGVNRVDAQTTLTRAVSVSVSANSKTVWAVLDRYPQVRARISSVASSPNILVRLYEVS